MATKKSKKGKQAAEPKKEVAAKKNKVSISKQFQGLDMSEPGLWPFYPQLMLCILVSVIVVILAWYFVLSDSYEAIEAAERQEIALKEEFTKKWTISRNLDALMVKRDKVMAYVTLLERKLPDETEMENLLRQISTAAETNKLKVITLTALPVIAQEYYVEQPIAVKLGGDSYHDVGRFAEALASLERIVTLDSVTLSSNDPNAGEVAGITLDGVLKTYRYGQADQEGSQEDNSRSGQTGNRNNNRARK